MPPQGQLLVHESLFKRQKMPGQLKRLQKKKSKSAWSVLLPGLCCPSGERAGGWDERHLEASQQNPSITFLRVKPPGKTTPSPVSLAQFPGSSPEVGDGRRCGCCRHPPGHSHSSLGGAQGAEHRTGTEHSQQGAPLPSQQVEPCWNKERAVTSPGKYTRRLVAD